MSIAVKSHIQPGSLLIREGTPIPASLRLETAAWPALWMAITGTPTPHQFETALTSAGWSFFYRAGTERETAFGFDRQKATHRALGRLAADATLRNCNCLEIDEVTGHSFCGIPWVSVSAHSRRIEKAA